MACTTAAAAAAGGTPGGNDAAQGGSGGGGNGGGRKRKEGGEGDDKVPKAPICRCGGGDGYPHKENCKWMKVGSAKMEAALAASFADLRQLRENNAVLLRLLAEAEAEAKAMPDSPEAKRRRPNSRK
jgi:hypothetical protein